MCRTIFVGYLSVTFQCSFVFCSIIIRDVRLTEISVSSIDYLLTEIRGLPILSTSHLKRVKTNYYLSNISHIEIKGQNLKENLKTTVIILVSTSFSRIKIDRIRQLFGYFNGYFNGYFRRGFQENLGCVLVFVLQH